MNKFINYDKIVLGKNAIFSSNCQETGLNNNIAVFGGSGCGKSRSVVEPTLLETNNSSLLVSDPKGALHKRYAEYFRNKGYKVMALDFMDIDNNEYGYDPIAHISKEQDIVSVSHRLIDRYDAEMVRKDPYWDNMAELVLSAIIAIVCTGEPDEKVNMTLVMKYFGMLEDGNSRYGNTLPLSNIVGHIQREYGNCMAVRLWNKIDYLRNAEKTWTCILSSVNAALNRFFSGELAAFFSNRNRIDFNSLATEKTVLFIKCSDTDDTMYPIINILYSQALDSLCSLADRQPDGKCPIPVKFILDDFATNVNIREMPRISSMIRARNISVMLILQSQAQLQKMYGHDADTIVSNCDSIVFMGTNDLETAKQLSLRLDIPVMDILYSPIGKVYIMRRGVYPIETERYDISQHPHYRYVYEQKEASEPER